MSTIMKRKILAALLSAAMALELAGPGNACAAAAVPSKVLTGKQRKMQREQEKFDKLRERRQKEQKKLLKEMSESRKRQGKKRKKASDAEKLSVTMSQLLQEDGTFQEAADGSEISINDALDLKNLGDYTNAGCNTAGVVFKQTADIDCTGVTMCAIGVRNDSLMDDEDFDYDSLYQYFSGTYDGGGHHISNVLLDERHALDGFISTIDVSLFPYVSEAVIQNINLDSIDFIWPDKMLEKENGGGDEEDDVYEYGEEWYLQIGAVVGIATDTVIENCNNYADITAPVCFEEMAGIVHTLGGQSVLRKCTNYGTLDAEGNAQDGYARITGIVLNSWGNEISDCVNAGDIRNARSVSGILDASISCAVNGCENRGNLEGDMYANGIASSVFGSIRNCKNSGNVTSKSWRAAGILNYHSSDWDTDTVSDCENSGSIQGSYASGILGGRNYEDIPVTRCKNMGTVTAEYTAGGIIGTCDYNVIVTNCTNEGAVSSKDCAGGIVGYGDAVIIAACINRGKVDGGEAAGGIAGTVVSQGSFWNLLNFGDVASEQNAGGVAGGCWSSSIVNAWNHGTVTGGVNAGGILGTSNSNIYYDEINYWEYEDMGREDAAGNKELGELANTIENCVHVGNVSVQKAAGAIIGESNQKDRVEYCYYLEGSAQKAHGSDDTVTAKKIKEWKTEGFIEELNQNVTAMGNSAALYMKQDSVLGVLWKPAVVLDTRIIRDYYMEEIGMGGQQYAGYDFLDFVLLQKSSGEYIPMTKGNNGFRAEVVQGEEYEVLRILSDGTYQQVGNVSMGEGDSIFVLSERYQIFQMFSQVPFEKQEDGSYQFSYENPYYTIIYRDVSEIALPEEPKREGYVFGGWYSTPYVCNEELYQSLKETTRAKFVEYRANLGQWYDNKEDDWDDYASKEEYVSDYLISRYGYDKEEDLMSQFDTYVDRQYKVENPVSFNYYDDLYVEYNVLFAKWIDPNAAVQTPVNDGQQADGQGTRPIIYVDPDPAEYAEPLGSLVEKSGVIYQVNRKKKTAQVTGVDSRTVKNIVICSSVTSGKVRCKVTSVGRKAFAGCKKLKKITVKGTNLKKVHKTALKGANKKIIIKADKKVKKLFNY